MRRGVGISGLQRAAATKESFREAGQILASAQIEQLQRQFQAFKSNLEEFAKKYQKEIKRNPLLRAHFQKMCSSIGVDPLASSKGFWAEILGVGDFYYELGIQVVESCLVWQETTGGLTDISVIKRRLSKLRGPASAPVTDDDICRAVATLKPLGSGYAVLDLGSRKAIQSLPFELSVDGSRLMSLGESEGFVTKSRVCKQLGWSMDRVERALEGLLLDGLTWVDEQAVDQGELAFWFPCYFRGFAGE